MTTITAKIQILPTQSDVQAMLDTFALYGRACNWLSKKVFETKTLNQFTLHKLFYETIYKAKEQGMSVVTIDPRYTSQTCPKCGHTHKGNRDKKNHRFTCLSCVYKSNDDRIGAMNIYRKGIELISQSDPAVAVEQVSIAKGEVNRPKG